MNEKPNIEETVPGRLDELRQSVDARFRAGDERMGRIEVDLAENTTTTNRIDANTAGLLEWFKAFEGAFKLLNGLGKLAKPLSYIGAAMAAIGGAWVAFRNGIGPK